MATNQTDGDWADQLVNGLQQLSTPTPTSEESKMTDDNYQPNNLEEKLNGANPSGTGNTQYQTNTATQTAQPTYSHEAVVQEHARNKGKISDFISKLTGRDKYSIESVAKNGKKIDSELEVVGLENLDKIPQVVRPYYVKISNFVKGDAQKRFKDAEKGLDSLISALNEVDNGMTTDLFGPGYESMKTQVGGLYGQAQELVKKEEMYKEGLKAIDQEIKDAGARREKIKSEYDQITDPNQRTTLANTALGIKFDMAKYERTKKQLISEYKGIKLEIKAVSQEITALDHLQTYVLALEGQATERKAMYRHTRKTTDYTASIIPLVGEFSRTLDIYTKFGGAFDKANYERLKGAAELTNVPTDGPKIPQQFMDNPLITFAKQREGEEEEIMNEIRSGPSNSFKDHM